MDSKNSLNTLHLCENKSECCGCSACSVSCPVNAISMEEDEEGFLYPMINQNMCIGCRRCVDACAFKKTYIGNDIPNMYAIKHNEKQVRKQSQSGGMFTALSDRFIADEGVVWGVVLNDEHLAHHDRADNESGRNRMRGSKYIQSVMGDSFKRVKEDIESGKKVLFTGTPCQIDGLRSFLKNDYDNLFCVDLICHGVPSPLVWRKYLEWQQDKHGSTIEKADFRDKKYPWGAHIETLFFKNGKVLSSNVFARAFYSHMCIRPSCYSCPYKQLAHPGDITIGDCWGIEKTAPEFYDADGVSLALINTPKGQALFDQVKENIEFMPCQTDSVMQDPLRQNFPLPEKRSVFWSDFRTYSFKTIAKKYCIEPHRFRRVLSRLRKKIGI